MAFFCLQGDQEAREEEEVSCEVARVEAAREAMVGQGQVFVPDCDPDTGHYRHTQVGGIMTVIPSLQLVLQTIHQFYNRFSQSPGLFTVWSTPV